MWQLRNGGEVAVQSSFSLFSFGGNWNQSNFESATAQATDRYATYSQLTNFKLLNNESNHSDYFVYYLRTRSRF